jgi:ethanolamine utilization protein EutQ (cupin superfamily)
MDEVGVSSKIIKLGKIKTRVISELRLKHFSDELIVFNINKVLKHVISEKHYTDITAEQLEYKIKGIVNNANYIAYDREQNSLFYIWICQNSEMVVFRTGEQLKACYVKSVYPTSFNKIMTYTEKPSVSLVYLGKV